MISQRLISAERIHNQTLRLHAVILYFSLFDVSNVLEYVQDRLPGWGQSNMTLRRLLNPWRFIVLIDPQSCLLSLVIPQLG
jgi:hypothetical protein